MMGVAELATAVKYGINLVGIIVNDGALTAIKGSQQKNHQGRVIDTDLVNPDFVELARSFGAYSRRVHTLGDFRGVLEESLAVQQPAIIEVSMKHSHSQLIEAITWLRSQPLRHSV